MVENILVVFIQLFQYKLLFQLTFFVKTRKYTPTILNSFQENIKKLLYTLHIYIHILLLLVYVIYISQYYYDVWRTDVNHRKEYQFHIQGVH